MLSPNYPTPRVFTHIHTYHTQKIVSSSKFKFGVRRAHATFLERLDIYDDNNNKNMSESYNDPIKCKLLC